MQVENQVPGGTHSPDAAADAADGGAPATAPLVGGGSGGTAAAPVRYDVTALSLTIYYNREGDHDHNGLVFALTANVPVLRYLDALARQGSPRRPGEPQPPEPGSLYPAAAARAAALQVDLPVTPEQARRPHPLVRPLVLRARVGDTVTVHLHNEVRGRSVGLHLTSDGYDVRTSDGSEVGRNAPSLAPESGHWDYTFRCAHEGVFPFSDGGDHDGGQDGTNVHGLFGALVVEPAGATWRDPRTGRGSHGPQGTGPFEQLDGLHLDVLPPGTPPTQVPASTTTLADHPWDALPPYPRYDTTAHREFVIFFHDEPEFLPPHGHLEPDPCHPSEPGEPGAGSSAHHELPPIMAVSYRAEPMVNRERTLWQRLRTGAVLDRPVLNEEQHHSSWMFGDPSENMLLQAYIGDPVRIRFVHAAVKETHVFHLHLYEWHAVAGNPDSPRIDAISISPQTGHTIEPVWGAGSRHQVAGDVIWHCHLYPHFHEGMWGIFRTFETRQDGVDGPPLAGSDPVYAGRRLGRYPDGTRIPRLLPLPLPAPYRPPPRPTPTKPGFPLFIPGRVGQKSPRPPWPDRELTASERVLDAAAPPCSTVSLRGEDMPADFDYRPFPTGLERAAFNDLPVPGEMFTRRRLAAQQGDEPLSALNRRREVCHDVAVGMRDITYNDSGWHDPHGHLYWLEAEGDPALRPGPIEPLFLRAQHGQIVNITLRNTLPEQIEETEFDPAFPPCPERPWEGECSPHVHMVKFDPICGDGASVGWNYMSGARLGRRMVYRWWADQQFGTIFFHDHLFANYRQKHGLFGALLVEPAGSTSWSPFEEDREIVTGLQAVVERHPAEVPAGQPPWFREFCIGIADFIPMWDRRGRALNPPAHPGGHGDQGVMALNYRNEPLRERSGDPAAWFSSRVHGDPATTVFHTYDNDPLWFRVVQGSHEESHSFQVHGMYWQRFRDQTDSAIRDQQSTGIAEAFTFVNRAPYFPGDHLYKLSGADDLWLGCWGLVRSHPRLPAAERDLLSRGPVPPPPALAPVPPAPVRTFRVTAVPRRLVYRRDLVDPYGLVYRLDSVQSPGQAAQPVAPPSGPPEPLVLWCRQGERVVVEITNGLPDDLEPEPFAPTVPLDRDRPVSSHASVHADLVAYDVRRSDGANVGLNPPQTAAPGGPARRYEWDTSSPGGASQEPLGPLLLQDMADVRNHRHHGLVGALVVLPADATPRPVRPDQSTSTSTQEAWHGARVTVTRLPQGGGTPVVTEEMVALLQDGLRLFLNGNERFPLPDVPPEEAGEVEHEDQGQKGINYRSEPLGRFDPRGSEYSLADNRPATPLWHVERHSRVRFHLVGALDKPRAYSFTIHGVAWQESRFTPPASTPVPVVASESAITSGTARTFEFTPEHRGDHAYRVGVLKWAVGQGMWGILRVT